MKGRPKSIRKIASMPTVSGFKPYGDMIHDTKGKCVFLYYEEYEALRLNDYEKHTQCESAAIMQVSRPTFTRIYMSAREKIAKAFVEGLRIVVEGGKVELDGNWFVCNRCKAIFSNEQEEVNRCALCGSEEIEPYQLTDTNRTETSEPMLPTRQSMVSTVKSGRRCQRRSVCRKSQAPQVYPTTEKNKQNETNQ